MHIQAKTLMKQSANGDNPYEGYKPKVSDVVVPFSDISLYFCAPLAPRGIVAVVLLQCRSFSYACLPSIQTYPFFKSEFI